MRLTEAKTAGNTAPGKLCNDNGSSAYFLGRKWRAGGEDEDGADSGSTGADKDKLESFLPGDCSLNMCAPILGAD